MDWDFVPGVEAAVGTMQSYVAGGGTFRIGRHITDFPYYVLRVNERAAVDALPLNAMRGSLRQNIRGALSDLEIHGYVGGYVKAVGYNYALEGSLFDNDRYTVEPNRYVIEFRMGVTARFKRFNISYALVRRTKEFVRTAGDDRGIHTFGALSLTVGIR